MKLSVSAFRAQASAQRKILSSYQNQLNYGACTSFPALGGFKIEEKPQMMVDSTGIGPANAAKPNDRAQNSDNSGVQELEGTKLTEKEDPKETPPDPGASQIKETAASDKSPGRTRSKSNQRWMKLRTTVQLSGAITSTNQKSKPGLKREDSFLKRFSTRQIPETQETVDTGDETETANGCQTQQDVNRRRRKRRKEMSRTVVNPDENFYFYWLMTVTVCVLYNLWTLIVRQSFPELQKAASSFWYAGDGFTDVVFVCDIVVQLRTGYLEQGLMVYNSKKLATHYLKSRAFILDILSLLPINFLQFNLGVNPILRFPRFLKVYRVYNYYYIVESRTVYPNLWRVVNLIHILLILAHWFGCFYYLLSEAEGFQGDWVYPYRPGDYATLTRKYLGSLYWSTLTLTTIGDLPTPETNAESRGRSKAMTSSGHSDGIHRRGHKSRLLQFNSNSGYLFTIISYLIGVFIFATIVGQVGNVITNRNANRLEFERLLDGAKTYMRHHKVPGGMKRRVLRWYDYSWSRGRIQGGGDINTALGLLPDKLKTELALHVNLSVLKKVTIFQECQPEFLHDLVLKMKAYIFTPGDLICRKGEVAREMFIIADGILDVISENGRVLTTMKAGDFFGEIGILNLDGLNKRTADVRSVGYSELFSLSREDVLTAMKDYPEAQEILQSLGRKRLMEAKNASKMHKAQAKQTKDPDSSGDSDTAGKRIVEKLRSDVKGLKNALRRSRRGTRTKDTFDGCEETGGGKTSAKKHSILRRMSHVQSSDEYEANNEIAHSPIGSGLPLLQRLKILKEKQEKEREEKEKNRSSYGTLPAKEEIAEKEVIGMGLPLTQRLKLLKQKEDKQASASGSAVMSSTVRTQVTGVRFDKTVTKAKTTTPPARESEDKFVVGESETKRKESVDVGRVSLKEKLKLVQSQAKGKLPSRTPEPESTPSSNLTSETSNNVPVDEENPVPKLGSKLEVPKSKDGWKLLKKSSLTSAKSKEVRKVPKKGTYLSKSDTVLEKQKTFEKDEEKRSRSISPSDGSKCHRKTLKKTVEELMCEKRRARSLSHSPKRDERKEDVNSWEFSTKEGDAKEEAEDKPNMKKYNSISDLSPEYSGLPFVKKLKILYERQKLEELEKELLVRSASLDVPDRPATKRGNLVRSQSEASTMELRKDSTGMVNFNSEWADGQRSSTKLRDVSAMQPESTVASPESNETLERRHLKSILKKLSGEDSTSDEDLTKNIKRSLMKRGENAELKKLMRAPTVEGYAARHKKLTKSVTFDSDALPSPPDPGPQDQPPDEKSKNFSPMSPTAILTLQLSNLSMIPIVSPKKSEKKEEKEKPETKMVGQLQEEAFVRRLEKENPFAPYVFHELVERNFRLLPLIKSQDDELFGQIKGGILEVLHQLLEDVQKKFQSQFDSLQVEVKKRDDIITQLQSKIQHLEQRNSSKREDLERDSSGTDPDLSEGPFLRGDSFETVLGMNSSPLEPVNVFMSRRGSPAGAENSNKIKEPALSAIPFDHLGNIITSEPEDDIFEMKDKISLLPTDTGTRRGLRRSLDPPSDEDIEMTETPKSFWSNEFKRKRYRPDFKLKRNFSVDETRLGAGSEKKAEWKTRSRGSLMERMADLQRSFSCSHEGTDFVALDIDESSNSDAETTHNKDWEVQMLVEELAKKDPDWEMDESDLEQFEDVKKLQEEVNTLKQMVCESDLTRLTSSELDMLETIIEAKDQKISQIAKSNSLDDEDKSSRQKRLVLICPSGSDNRLKKNEKKKPTLRQKIGQAFSFDSHDMESRKPDQRSKAFHLRKQKTVSVTQKERQSLYDLWHTSSLLRNRMLEDSDKVNQNVARSSLPILISDSLQADKSSELRTSLPLLSGIDLPGMRSSVSSSEEQGSDFRQSCDSVFEEAEAVRNFGYPSTSGQVRSSEYHSSSSLNNFIKSMGQKMKQVMGGDATAARSQVPTISRLCDEQAMLKEQEMEVLESFGGVPSEEEPKPFEGETPEVMDSFDRDPKTDPPDL